MKTKGKSNVLLYNNDMKTSNEKGTTLEIAPHNIEMEKALLGSVILDSAAISKVLDKIDDPSYFYQPLNAKIYKAMISLFKNNSPIDFITLKEELRKDGVDIEDQYLASLVDYTPSPLNVETYADLVKDKATLRELIRVSHEIASLAYEDVDDIKEILDKAESRIFRIAGDRTNKSISHISGVIKSGISFVERLTERKGAVTGVPSGFTDIDEKTAGLQPSDLIVIAGRPSMGKTAFAVDIAQNFALTDKEAVILIFSLEMSSSQLAIRMLASQAKVSGHRIRKGYVGKEDWPKITAAANRLYSTNIFIDDTPTGTTLDIRAKSRRLKSEKKRLDLIIIDYLQLMNVKGKAESRNLEISEITRSLKQLAKELSVPVIAISQLSRKVEDRVDKRPQLADLRESGSIEQDADLVMFVYREEFYNQANKELENIAEIIIGKQRNGPVGSSKLAFLKDFTRFENLAQGYPEPLDSSFEEIYD